MLTSELLLQSQRFRVERVSRVLADGTQHTREIVRHPGAVTIIPLLDDHRICLVDNFRVAVNERLLELPAGTLEPPEEPMAAALRELAEETGYRASHIECLTTLCMSPGILDEKMYVFVASHLTAGDTSLEAGEDIQVLPLAWEEALERIRDGRIRDAKTVAALLYYDAFHRRD